MAVVLFLCHMFHPIDHFTIESFLNRNMSHAAGCGGAVPMLLAGWKPNHVAGVNFLNGSAFALDPAGARSDDQGLPEWMSVPCGARARLEGDVCSGASSGWVRLK